MIEKDLISIHDLEKSDIDKILTLAEKFEKNPFEKTLKNKVIATIFYEPSTRTRLSFESATNKIGGKIIGFSDPNSSSSKKGESLKDTMIMLEKYADLIILRHPNEGSAKYASEISSKPVINAGDGSNQHPTQTLLDLYSIKKTQKTLKNLKIAIAGDLKYGRTVHSLVIALTHYNPQFVFIAPTGLEMPDYIKNILNDKKIKFSESSIIEDSIKDVDILYMTRIQKERFTEAIEFENIKKSYILRKDMLEETKDNLKILHPLPRVWEIESDVDETKKAYYFKQAENGIFVRQAIITLLLNKK